MILTIAGYILVSIAALFWGKRLYGSWSAAIVLAIVSPIPFAIIGPLISLAVFALVARFLPLIGSPQVNLDNEWIQGAAIFFSAVVCALALRHFAKTEGVKENEPNQPP